MIISVRGTNGSGKTAIVNELLTKGHSTPIYGVLGAKLPQAHRLVLSGVTAPVFVLGPYSEGWGGCDRFRNYSVIVDLIKRYAAQGHVVFEGFVVGTTYGVVGTLLEKWGKDAVFLFLTTSFDDCVKHLQARRRDGVCSERLIASVREKHIASENIKVRVKAEGKVRSESTRIERGAALMLKLLREASK